MLKMSLKYEIIQVSSIYILTSLCIIKEEKQTDTRTHAQIKSIKMLIMYEYFQIKVLWSFICIVCVNVFTNNM